MKYQKTHNACGERTSDILKDIASTTGGGETTIGNFVILLGNRSFALSILIFSLPNALPVPGIPFLSTVTGVPILLIALQIMSGRKAIWLPPKISGKHFQQKLLAKVIHKMIPVVRWIEKFLRPRLSILCGSTGERFIGFLIAIMAFILALPIAGTNFLAALSIALLALALLEKDGFFAVLSIVFSLSSLYAMYEVIVLVVGSAAQWISEI